MAGFIHFLVALAAAAEAPAPAPQLPDAGVERLWTDWRVLVRQSSAAEAAQLEIARAQASSANESEARALGERVGQMVAAGDCAEGERMARAAGDMGLARAVRDFCYE